MLVHEKAHQFRDRERRMRVVELDCGVVGQRKQAAMLREMVCDEILQRRRGEEIFLPKAQFLALRAGIARIEDFRDGARARLPVLRLDMVALVEGVEVQGIGRARPPEAQVVDPLPRQPTTGMS